MAPDEYTKALDKALSDLDVSIRRRQLLIAEIAGLRATVRVLSTLVPLPSDKQQQVAQLLAMADYATPNLTDEIRLLLTRIYPKEMTAIEVRNELEEDSSNTDDSNISLSACHAALKRMFADKELEYGPTRDGKTTYRMKLEDLPVMRPFGAPMSRLLNLSMLSGQDIDEAKLPEMARSNHLIDKMSRHTRMPAPPKREK